MLSRKLGPHFVTLIDQINQINLFKFGQTTDKLFGGSIERLKFKELGCQLFDELIEIGQICNEHNLSSLADQSQLSRDIKDQVQQSAKLIFNPISANICHFLDTYPSTTIEASGEPISEEWCIVRSGYKFLLDLFRDVSINGDGGHSVNIGLNKFTTYRTAFDLYLKNWHDTAFDIDSSQVPKNVPKSHWWWFK